MNDPLTKYALKITFGIPALFLLGVAIRVALELAGVAIADVFTLAP